MLKPKCIKIDQPKTLLFFFEIFLLALFCSSIAQAQQKNKIKYFFPELVEINSPPVTPFNWPSKLKEPARMLALGMPQPISRPELVFAPAVFIPQELGLLLGNSRIVQAYNRAVTSWSRNELAEVEAIIQANIPLAKQLPKSHVERRNFFLLRGHYFFRKWIALGPKEKESSKQIRVQFMSSYFEVYGAQDTGALYTETGLEVDGAMLRASLQNGYVLDRNLFLKSGKPVVGGQMPPMQVREKVISPALQLKSQSLSVIWSAAVLQGQSSDWQKAFELAATGDAIFQKLGPDGPEYSGSENNAVIQVYDVNTVSNVISILPKRRTDFAGALNLMRANAFFKARDLIGIIEYAEKSISRSEDPLLRAAAFHLVGNIYFDTAHYGWAKKVYQWAIESASSYAEYAPSIAFFAAESEFWLGSYPTAKKLYQDFLTLVGDKTFGPHAKLRLALLDHLNLKVVEAATQYEQIQRLHPKHIVAADARVRLYCLSNLNLTTRFQKMNLQAILQEVETSRDDLREQAMACAVKNEIAIASEPWKNEKARETLALSAKASIQPIQKFGAEYPESSFKSLYETEHKQLSLMEGKLVLETENCRDILDFYMRQGSVLFSKQAGNARWNSEEKKRLLRCAFLKSETKILKEGIDAGWEPAHTRTQKLLVALQTKPSALTRQALRKEMGTHLNLAELAEEREKLDNDVLTAPRFWMLLAAHTLYTWDFANGKVTPKIDSNSPTDCLKELDRSEKGKPKDLESIYLTRNAKDWIEVLTQEAPKETPESRCLSVLAQRLLNAAKSGVSRLLSDGLWFALLGQKELKSKSFEWLEYAQYKETNAGKKEAKALYEKISKEADEGMEKEAAKLWLQNNP